MAKHDDITIEVTTNGGDVFKAARLVRARPGDLVVFSGVPVECHETLLEYMKDVLPEGVKALVFEDETSVDVIRPRDKTP